MNDWSSQFLITPSLLRPMQGPEHEAVFVCPTTRSLIATRSTQSSRRPCGGFLMVSGSFAPQPAVFGHDILWHVLEARRSFVNVFFSIYLTSGLSSCGRQYPVQLCGNPSHVESCSFSLGTLKLHVVTIAEVLALWKRKPLDLTRLEMTLTLHVWRNMKFACDIYGTRPAILNSCCSSTKITLTFISRAIPFSLPGSRVTPRRLFHIKRHIIYANGQ